MSEILKKFNKKQIILGASVFIAILAIGGGWWWIKSGSIVSTEDARVKGTIISVSSKVPGRIDKILVNEGDEVEAGQVLATVETAELEVQVAQAKANLAAAQAKLAEVKSGSRPQQIAQAGAVSTQAAASMDNAQRNYERIQALYQQGAISAQQRDAAETALAVARAQFDGAMQGYSLATEGAREEDIKIAEAQAEQAAAVFKNAQLTLDNAIIKAPSAGVVAVKSIDQGEIVAAGQPLFNITNLKEIWVAANIEETYAGKVQEGQTVEFTIDAYPGRTFKGEVSEVGSATGSQFALLPTENTSGNFTKVTQRLPVKIKVLEESNVLLKPGMSAVINIHVK